MRFYDGDRRLLDPDARIEALRDALNDECMLRQDAEARAADEARARRDAEQRAAEAADELARMKELLKRLRGGGG